MRPYVIQSFRNELGQTADAWLIDPRNDFGRVQEVRETAVTLRPEAHTVYSCGELTALTLTDCPASGSFLVIFISGPTATVLTVPESLVMPDEFQVDANTRYEIYVRDGYALCAGWAVSAS